MILKKNLSYNSFQNKLLEKINSKFPSIFLLELFFVISIIEQFFAAYHTKQTENNGINFSKKLLFSFICGELTGKSSYNLARYIIKDKVSRLSLFKATLLFSSLLKLTITWSKNFQKLDTFIYSIALYTGLLNGYNIASSIKWTCDTALTKWEKTIKNNKDKNNETYLESLFLAAEEALLEQVPSHNLDLKIGPHIASFYACTSKELNKILTKQNNNNLTEIKLKYLTSDYDIAHVVLATAQINVKFVLCNMTIHLDTSPSYFKIKNMLDVKKKEQFCSSILQLQLPAKRPLHSFSKENYITLQLDLLLAEKRHLNKHYITFEAFNKNYQINFNLCSEKDFLKPSTTAYDLVTTKDTQDYNLSNIAQLYPNTTLFLLNKTPRIMDLKTQKYIYKLLKLVSNNQQAAQFSIEGKKFKFKNLTPHRTFDISRIQYCMRKTFPLDTLSKSTNRKKINESHITIKEMMEKFPLNDNLITHIFIKNK